MCEDDADESNGRSSQLGLFDRPRKATRPPALPADDNTPEGLQALLKANAHYRDVPWPEPFHRTTHRVRLGDARNLSWIPEASVRLIVTSPPYWTLKEYAAGKSNQMGHFEDYEHFLSELDRVWRECTRVLVGGGGFAALSGTFVFRGSPIGRHHVVPLHSDIRKPVPAWRYHQNDIEYILFLRKGGEYRTTPALQKALSMLTKQEMKTWFRSIWSDLRGASTREGHPASYPVELAERLINMFSFAGDTVLGSVCRVAGCYHMRQKFYS